MKVRCAILLAVAFLFCGVSFAQDAVSSKIAIRLADSDCVVSGMIFQGEGTEHQAGNYPQVGFAPRLLTRTRD